VEIHRAACVSAARIRSASSSAKPAADTYKYRDAMPVVNNSTGSSVTTIQTTKNRMRFVPHTSSVATDATIRL
jgi:hypothetical protein